jgi:6-phosphogluconolactonase
VAKAVDPTVRIYPTLEAASRAAAEGFVDLANRTLQEQELFSVALAGGSTPQHLYEILADEHIDGVPWNKVHLYWGDERYVPHRDPRSNFRMFHGALLDRVHIPLENIHPMPTHRTDPQNAARDYERFLRSQFDGAWPALDVVLLGLGADGHTASLFPHSPALEEKQRWVVATEAPVEPTRRLSLTLPVLNAADNVSFLVAGKDKAAALSRVLAGPVDLAECPAGAVRPSKGRLIWWLDEAAASQIDEDRLKEVRLQRFD